MNRRELLAGAASIPALAVLEAAPLSAKELAFITYATPNAEHVTFERDSDESSLIRSLAARGYLERRPEDYEDGVTYYIRTPLGDKAIGL